MKNSSTHGADPIRNINAFKAYTAIKCAFSNINNRIRNYHRFKFFTFLKSLTFNTSYSYSIYTAWNIYVSSNAFIAMNQNSIIRINIKSQISLNDLGVI